MRYGCIASDPPWQFDDELKKMRDGTKRGAASQYPVLDLHAIKNLPVQKLADPAGCVLALWCPSVLIPEGLEVMKSWGFAFKQTYVWVKCKKHPVREAIDTGDVNSVLGFGMGRLFRQTHEVALIGTSGKSVYPQLKSKSERSVSIAFNEGHSVKPENLQDSLDAMFPSVAKLEMFARRKREGWDCVGNEVCDGEDIRDSLDRLIISDDS